MKNINDILVSVIVPVYNVKKYLSKCLDSLLIQTHKNVEIILVDDGSTDGSEVIVDDYAARDCRIKVIHKPNGGLSSARNAGVDISNGEYLMFVDSDDWVEPEFCETPLSIAIQQNVKCVSFGYNKVDYNDNILEPLKTQHPRVIDSLEGIKELITKEDVIYNITCNKLFHVDLFKNVRFPIGFLYEDNDTTYRLFDAAKTIFVDDSILYNYRYHESSISHQWYKPEALKCRFELWSKRLLFIKDNYPNLIDEQIKQLGNEALTGMHVLYWNNQYKGTYNIMKQFLKDNKQNLLRLLPNIRTRLYYYFKPLYYLYYMSRTIFSRFF